MKINLPIVVRLALWNTSILLIALLIFGFISYYFISRELFYEQQNLLQESGEQVSEIIRVGHGRLDTKHLRHESMEELNFSKNGIFFELVNKQGKSLFRSPNFPYHFKTADKIPVNQIRQFSDKNGSIFSILSVPVTIRSRYNNHKKVHMYFIHVGQSVKYVVQILKRIRHLFFWLLPAVLLLTSLGGWYMAKQSLKPVVKITATARGISLNNLGQRLTTPKIDDELGMLTTTFNEMIDRIRTGVNQIQQFTADASHELRTPLTIMRGEIEVALRHKRSIDEYKTKLKDMHAEILWMSKIIENLLTLSRVESDKNFLELKKAEPDDLIKDVLESFNNTAAKENIAIEYKSGKKHRRILMDRDKIRLILSNLLDNAIKYTENGGKVKVLLSEHEKGVLIDVIDTGIGIEEKDLPFVFDRFFRVDKSRSRYGMSTGLGLAICKLIVDAHKGNITIESKLNKGTTVQIFLPNNPTGEMLSSI